MKKTNVNIEEDEHAPNNAADLAYAARLAAEMRDIERQLQALALSATTLTNRYNEIQDRVLPDLMTQIGMKQFKLESGEEVSIKDFCRASIPTLSAIEKSSDLDQAALIARRNACMKWLRDNKAGDLIKNELSASFGKGEDKKAKQALRLLKKEGVAAALEESVNFQTLNAFIREQLTKGVDVPVEPFSLFTGKKAVVTPPKPAKVTK